MKGPNPASSNLNPLNTLTFMPLTLIMVPLRHILSVLFYAFACSAFTLSRRAPTPGQLSQVTDFGENPTNVGFYIYVPANLATSPAVVVAIHYCINTLLPRSVLC